MKHITPHLWFDSQAEEAVQFYTSIFPNSSIGTTARYGKSGAEVSGQPEGSIMSISFNLNGQSFMAINGGPIFTFTPAISFFVTLKTVAEVDELWNKLIEGGNALMELASYPFSEKYGWLQDKYGLSWQLMVEKESQMIRPSLLFVRDQAGKAETAMNFYTSLFPNSEIGNLARYEAGEADVVGYIKYGNFTLNGQSFIAMDSSGPHEFGFTEAISLMVNCDTQEEIDELWEKLSAVPESEQCGWLKDQFGVSWQIVPANMNEFMQAASPEKQERAMQAMLQMKKIDVASLEKAIE